MSSSCVPGTSNLQPSSTSLMSEGSLNKDSEHLPRFPSFLPSFLPCMGFREVTAALVRRANRRAPLPSGGPSATGDPATGTLSYLRRLSEIESGAGFEHNLPNQSQSLALEPSCASEAGSLQQNTRRLRLRLLPDRRQRGDKGAKIAQASATLRV
jgi:hypothetical protein